MCVRDVRSRKGSAGWIRETWISEINTRSWWHARFVLSNVLKATANVFLTYFRQDLFDRSNRRQQRAVSCAILVSRIRTGTSMDQESLLHEMWLYNWRKIKTFVWDFFFYRRLMTIDSGVRWNLICRPKRLRHVRLNFNTHTYIHIHINIMRYI